MSQAFVLCPETGDWIYVGLNLEWLGLDGLDIGKQESMCPICGKTHEWSAEEVVLRSDGSG